MAEPDLSPANTALMPLAGGGPLDRIRMLTGQPLVRRALPWFIGAAAIGGVALTWSVLSPAPQRILYSELDDNSRAGVVSSLDKAGIAYTIDNSTGTLTVAEDDLYKARMLVAQDGSLGTPDPTASLDSLPLGASKTLEGERLRAAREHELQLTIQEIEGVDGVRVHLAEGAKSVFVRDNSPPTASVMLRMKKGRQLSDSQVAAIVNLVAGSVPGLSADAVRVVDGRGKLLSAGGSADSDRLELQGRLEDKLRAQLDTLLTPMLGMGNYSSEIQVELDMDEVTSARERFDKDGVVRSETQEQSQASTAGPGQAQGIPGQLSNTPPPAATATPGPPQGQTAQATPAQPAATGESSASRTYELGREVSVANSAPGKIKRLSVAVAVSQEVMKKAKPGDIDQIKALVAAAMGLDTARGDQIQVLIRPFDVPADIALPFYEAPWFAMVVRTVAALLGVLLVLLMGVRPLVRALKRDPAAPSDMANEGSGDAAPAGTANTPVDAAVLGRQVGLAQRIVEEKPEDALIALRAMLGQAAPEAEQ
ncbi:MAG: flagellar basal-body MS-ring/collar protein FliF [Novosphingobium sp.]|uniref:flagellar basal-body MS-ring/collar protein FliF n=1 Tax=Novosphingobium sp. TaxID=1874826 RepID=UPI0032BB8F63